MQTKTLSPSEIQTKKPRVHTAPNICAVIASAAAGFLITNVKIGGTLSPFLTSLISALTPLYGTAALFGGICSALVTGSVWKCIAELSAAVLTVIYCKIFSRQKGSRIKAIAAGLGLPYMKYTCSANTEIFDFVGMIFPDSEDSTGSAQLDAERETLIQMGGINYANVSKLMKLPDLDDMDYDPAGVYMALTGVENAAATSQDCMSIVLDRVTEKVRELSKTVKDKNSSGQTYRYVETDFVKALKHGYVIEIQEPSTIVQPGVLVGLNSLLEQSGSITLPTGEVIQRHPDAVVVVTTNTSYEGCRGMNQSVLDRMSLVRDVELPSPEVMAQRAMSVTGATDEYEVSKMVQVVNDLAEYCRKNSITDGSYGMRSLIDWIISSEITGDVYESALYTIISKATADELDREALISTVLEPIFAPKRHKASA